MKKIVFATNNQHKLDEVKKITEGLIEIVSLSDINCTDDIEETADTLEGNALLKARYIKEKFGFDCFADDTGLEVEVLNNAPGVYSARYAGYHADDATNNQKMLEELCIADVEESSASYCCALTFVDTDGTVFTTNGRCNGTIRKWPKGHNGFGYDPYFYTREFAGRTMAELNFEEKDRISHRGRALRQMVSKLEDYLK